MHSGILCSSKRKWNTVFAEKAGLTGNHCVKWSNPDLEMQMLYIFFHMWKLNLNSCPCAHTPHKTRKEEVLLCVRSGDGKRPCVVAAHKWECVRKERESGGGKGGARWEVTGEGSKWKWCAFSPSIFPTSLLPSSFLLSFLPSPPPQTHTRAPKNARMKPVALHPDLMFSNKEREWALHLLIMEWRWLEDFVSKKGNGDACREIAHRQGERLEIKRKGKQILSSVWRADG